MFRLESSRILSRWTGQLGISEFSKFSRSYSEGLQDTSHLTQHTLGPPPGRNHPQKTSDGQPHGRGRGLRSLLRPQAGGTHALILLSLDTQSQFIFLKHGFLMVKCVQIGAIESSTCAPHRGWYQWFPNCGPQTSCA